MAKRTKTRRRVWTDDEKRQLVAEIEALPPGESKEEWFKQRGVNSSWFYHVRKKMRSKKPSATPQKLAPAPTPATTFGSAGAQEKRRLLAEHDALPKGERAAWRRRHDVRSQLLTYYRSRQGKAAPKGKGSLINLTNENIVDMAAEYMTLTGNGEKGAWLKKHGLNHQSVFELKKKAAKLVHAAAVSSHAPAPDNAANGNAATNLPAVVPKPQAIPKPQAPVRRTTTRATYSHIPVAAPSPAIVLQHGIDYLTMKRDVFTEIIEDLNRVLRGSR